MESQERRDLDAARQDAELQVKAMHDQIAVGASMQGNAFGQTFPKEKKEEFDDIDKLGYREDVDFGDNQNASMAPAAVLKAAQDYSRINLPEETSSRPAILNGLQPLHSEETVP